jgi:hypothetical protein
MHSGISNANLLLHVVVEVSLTRTPPNNSLFTAEMDVTSI